MENEGKHKNKWNISHDEMEAEEECQDSIMDCPLRIEESKNEIN